jgi:hypothetical protein
LDAKPVPLLLAFSAKIIEEMAEGRHMQRTAAA